MCEVVDWQRRRLARSSAAMWARSALSQTRRRPKPSSSAYAPLDGWWMCTVKHVGCGYGFDSSTSRYAGCPSAARTM